MSIPTNRPRHGARNRRLESSEDAKTIKHLFDPENRLNPGNIVAPEPMTTHLRVMPEGHAVNVPADLDTVRRKIVHDTAAKFYGLN